VYGEHDRPSTRRIVLTIIAIAVGGALMTWFASVLFGLSMNDVPNTEAASTSLPVVQAPATMTVSVDEVHPAKSSSITTSQVAASLSATLLAQRVATITPKGAAIEKSSAAAADLGVVVIDAGHQGKGNSSLEPMGPGSKTKKAKVEGGASGVATHVDESKRNLEVALRLKKVLEARGVKVVMVRTSQNVNIANSKRAKIANDAKAALFVRLHCDSGGSSAKGILTLRPAKNWYSGVDMVGPSKKAADYVHKAVLAKTGAKNRGITPRSDLSGFNWAKVPSVLVEMGMMSNSAEDKKLGTAAYQDKLAEGMADGIMKYLSSR
jgi:N-acetylmuramoyl-L-alanine amidase